MNANRALGLLAAILITAGQATLLAVDTSAATERTAAPGRYDTTLDAKNVAESPGVSVESPGQVGS